LHNSAYTNKQTNDDDNITSLTEISSQFQGVQNLPKLAGRDCWKCWQGYAYRPVRKSMERNAPKSKLQRKWNRKQTCISYSRNAGL